MTGLVGKDRERYLELKRQLKHRYGLAIETFLLLYEKQEFKCAICKVELIWSKQGLHVDHCHATNTLRGLLCGRCNMGLGYFKDNADVLLEAANYIARHKTAIERVLKKD